MRAALRRHRAAIAHLARLVTDPVEGPDPETEMTYLRELLSLCAVVLAAAPSTLW